MLSTTVAEVYSFNAMFSSCCFWMDIAGEVANFHMRTDAKNLVTTARTTHLLEQKETIHMISMLRKEACSGNIHDLAHSPTQHCLADCLSKASAKADNLITAKKTLRLLTFSLILEHSWNTRLYLLGVEHLCTQGRRIFYS